MHSDWQKSSRCAEGNNCVELRRTPRGGFEMRESADPAQILALAPDRMGDLLRAVRAHGDPLV